MADRKPIFKNCASTALCQTFNSSKRNAILINIIIVINKELLTDHD